VKWLEDYTPEEVRFALVIARREGKMTLQDFEIALSSARWSLRGEEAEA
jgi:hypothetical protein